MGLANLVPGISGGTMLLAVGVYPQFIGAVAQVTTLRFTTAVVLLLTCVGAGAAGAVAVGAGAIGALLDRYPSGMYCLFIGLTLGGVPLLWRLLRPADRTVTYSAAVAVGLMGPSLGVRAGPCRERCGGRRRRVCNARGCGVLRRRRDDSARGLRRLPAARPRPVPAHRRCRRDSRCERADRRRRRCRGHPAGAAAGRRGRGTRSGRREQPRQAAARAVPPRNSRFPARAAARFGDRTMALRDRSVPRTGGCRRRARGNGILLSRAIARLDRDD